MQRTQRQRPQIDSGEPEQPADEVPATTAEKALKSVSVHEMTLLLYMSPLKLPNKSADHAGQLQQPLL